MGVSDGDEPGEFVGISDGGLDGETLLKFVGVSDEEILGKLVRVLDGNLDGETLLEFFRVCGSIR